MTVDSVISIAWVLLPAALALSWLLTAAVRRYALHAKLLDHPNERSSHVLPTPRGGGVAIVLSCLGGTLVLAGLGIVGARPAAVICASGAWVAMLGFIDDRRPLPARVRFVGHLLAGAAVTWWLAPLPALPFLGLQIPLDGAGPVLAVLFIVWSINLFNFMDGIDGIASIETVTVGLGGAGLWALAGTSTHWLIPVLLACSAAGFLLWNFPPARIFMGDAGSGFLGLMIAILALWSGTEQPQLFWGWLILYGCFFVDATVTLLRRARRGDRFYQAHRSHAYQYASRRLGGHRPVSLAVGLINLVWLLPVAALVSTGRIDGGVGLAVAYVPLVVLAFRYKAGDRKGQES